MFGANVFQLSLLNCIDRLALALVSGVVDRYDNIRDADKCGPDDSDEQRISPPRSVRLRTSEGQREVWGIDIERAIKESLSRPQIGDEVILQRTGRNPVTVQRAEKDAQGALQPKALEVFRNRWAIETRTFFEERADAAQIVRNETIGPRDGVRKHPELAGTYLNLRAAELASHALRDPQDRRRFVARVRSVLADDIERGEPVQPVRLRERPRRSLVEDLEKAR